MSRSVKRVLPFIVLVLTLAARSQALLAKDLNTFTWNGIPLAETRTFEIQGRLFQFPIGYLPSWNNPGARGQVIKHHTLSFGFWMPSLRFPEVERSSTATNHPKEPGRESSRQNEFVVDVDLVTFDLSKKVDEITPQRMFENFISTSGLSAFSFHEAFGLTGYKYRTKPNTFDRYREIEGTQPKVLVRCTRIEDDAPNPLCTGFVHFEENDLQFWVKFSLRDLDHWRESVIAARDLILKWQVPKIE
jgi:hypothetical protein